MKKLSGKRRVSPSIVVAMLALVVALGAGAAYAKTHFLITSKSQIKPSLLKALKGAKGANGADGRNGTNGANGANGATGASGPQGAQGPQGPQGPGAVELTASVGVGQVSTPAVGNPAVELRCTQESGVALAELVTTYTDNLPFVAGGYSSTWTQSSFGSGTQSVSAETISDNFNTSGVTEFVSASTSNTHSVGTALLYISRISVVNTHSSETVTFDLSPGSGTGASGTCNVDAQVVPSG